MYLSELFLNELEKGRVPVAALKACDDELKERLRYNYETENLLQYFFGSESNNSFTELMDLWDVFCDFGELVTNADLDKWDINILYWLYEMDGIHQGHIYDRHIEEMGQQAQETLIELGDIIERIYTPKYLRILKRHHSKWENYCELPLEDFINIPSDFSYFAVMNCLSECLQNGGLAVVVAGSEGITPQRLYGFKMGNMQWKQLTQKELTDIREEVLIKLKVLQKWEVIRGRMPCSP